MWDIFYFLIFSPLIFIPGLKNKRQMFQKVGDQTRGFFILGEKVFIFLSSVSLIGLMGSWLPLQVYPLFIFFLSFCLWGSAILTWVCSNFRTFFSHHTPRDLNFFIGPVISLIEIIRTVLRPMILGLRLIANIIGGHLLIELIWEILGSYSLLRFLGLYECFVCLIQRVIFSLLAIDYYSEVGE